MCAQCVVMAATKFYKGTQSPRADASIDEENQMTVSCGHVNNKFVFGEPKKGDLCYDTNKRKIDTFQTKFCNLIKRDP